MGRTKSHVEGGPNSYTYDKTHLLTVETALGPRTWSHRYSSHGEEGTGDLLCFQHSWR
jgi:hypothetical protein